MRSNKEQTEYILKKRDEYNRNMAKKKRTFLYAFPTVAIISILIITAVVTISLSSKQYKASTEIAPSIGNEADGFSTMNNKSNSTIPGYLPSGFHVDTTSIATSSPLSERNDSHDSSAQETKQIETKETFLETNKDYPETSQTITKTEQTTTTIATTLHATPTIAATESMSTSIATTNAFTTNVVGTDKSKTIIETTNLTPNGMTGSGNAISCYNNTFTYCENTFNSIAIADQKTETQLFDSSNNEYYAYKIKNVSEKYSIYVTDKENSYIYYTDANIYSYKDLVNDFNLDSVVKEFTKFDGNTSKEDLLNVYSSFSYDETETSYVYSKNITLLSGAKSGPTTIYRFVFNLDKNGHGRLDIYSYFGDHLVACAYFKYSNK